MKQAHSAFPRGVIDVVSYHDELSLIRDWLESAPDKTPQIPFLEEAGVQLARFRDAERIAPRRSKNSDRIAVAAGQYLLWCSTQLHASSVASARETQCYYDLFALYWSLLKRRLKLNTAMATDLIKIERASRGVTELRHALVMLLERNFAPIAPRALRPLLRDWADELSIQRKATFRKLAQRIWKLAGVKT